jgi:D-alanyl-D-alanine carboxypeptidase
MFPIMSIARFGAVVRRLMPLVLLLGTASFPLPRAAAAAPESGDDGLRPPEVSAESAILIDGDTGMALYEKNADERMFPASITKIATAIVALETANLDDIVAVSKEARNEDGTRVYLAEGERKTMRDLLYAMMLNSGNDAATAIAEHIDGTKAKFAERLNDFAVHTVGVTHTHFTNPSGLPDPDHYTTAADMAQIARYAMRNDMFRQIVSTRTMPWNGKEWQSTLLNHNKLLGTYEGATGIKNGYTEAAGSTLVASARRGGMELIGVVLKSASSDAMYADMTRLLDYGFQHFELRRLFAQGDVYPVRPGEPVDHYVAAAPIDAVVPIGRSASYTVAPDGQVTVSTPLGEQPAGRLQMVLAPPSAAVALAAGGPAGPPGSPVIRTLITVVWLMMIAFLATIGGLLIRRRRRQGRWLRGN